MRTFREHLLLSGSTIRQALQRLDLLAKDAITFIVDEQDVLIGSLTDGDVRRGLLRGMTIDDEVDKIIQDHPKFIRKGNFDIQELIKLRDGHYRIIPILDKDNRVVNVINFREIRSYLPVDAVVMAGGRGERLRPLTDSVPKPLLKVGDKSIMEHNIDRLAMFGIDDFWFSVNYLAEQIQDYFGTGVDRNIAIRYVKEDKPLGTIGAVSLIDRFSHDYILLTNSDILTDLDYEHFFLDFIENDSDFSVVTIPYQVGVPYAVLETANGRITSFKEKPTYTYYSNGGIYLMKRSVLDTIPRNEFFNATDLMQALIADGHKVTSYPLRGYWLDIGRHDDYQKAQQDIKHIRL